MAQQIHPRFAGPLSGHPGDRVDAGAARRDEIGPTPAAPTIGGTFAILRRHVWLALSIAVVVSALLAYVLNSAEAQYRARAVIRLSDSRQALTGGLVGPQGDADAAELKTDLVLSQVQVLLSRAVVGQVVDEGHAVGLRVDAEGFPQEALGRVLLDPRSPTDTVRLRFEADGLVITPSAARAGAAGAAPAAPAPAAQRVAYDTPIELPGLRFRISDRPDAEEGMIVIRSRDEAVDALLGELRANPRQHTDVIDVTFTASDPAVAQQVVNGVVKVFVSLNARQSQDQSRRRQDFLQEQIRQTDSLLLEMQRALVPFLNQHQTSAEEEDAAASRSRMLELAGRREELDADRRVYADLLTALLRQQQGAGTDGGANRLPTLVYPPGTQTNPVITQLYGELVRYQTTRDSLTTGAWASASTHPDVQRLDALIESAEERLVDAARSHVASLETRIRALEEIRRSNATPRQRPAMMAAEESRLQEQLTTLQKMGDQLRDEYQKARIAASVEGGRVEIVDLATLPSAPTGVGRTRKTAFAVVLGVMAGAAVAMAIDFLQRMSTAIRRRDQLETELQLPALAVVPPHLSSAGRGNVALRGAARLPFLRRRGGNAGTQRSLVLSPTAPQSAASEAYRALRTNLLYSQAVQELRIIGVTSAAPGEGKSTTASNLAVAFAEQGVRVLLVDCDLRRARVHTIFGMGKEPGLTQLILGTAPREVAIRTTEFERLSVLPAGSIPPNPSELLGSTQFAAILSAERERFDLVIVDSPPVLVATDAAVLGRLVDGMLLVVRAGQTELGAAREALRQLSIVDARVTGAILNDPDGKVRSGEGGYYSYTYYGAAHT